METIKEILMTRDNLSEMDADNLIHEALIELYEHMEMGDLEQAEMVPYYYFGLEPDYLMELLEIMGA